MAFDGFTSEAVDCYARLAEDNSKENWKKIRGIYEEQVRNPVTGLAAELSAEFGEITVLRPQRDSRFSNDKSPYKLYQGAFVDLEPCVGFWVQLDADGVYASGRFYPWSPEQVKRYRAAVDDARAGGALAGLVADLEAAGLTVGGDRLRTRPRGVPADHPRLSLLRHRSLDIGLRFPPDAPRLGGPEAVPAVASVWRRVRPVLDWVSAHVRPSA